jgi:hypothetical protein
LRTCEAGVHIVSAAAYFIHCNAAPVERVLLAHHIFLKPQSNILFSH